MRFRNILLTAAAVIGLAFQSRAETPLIGNPFARKSVSLNGDWNYIIDPYDTGYRDYRQHLYDAAAKPSGGYFLDQKPRNPSDLVEYNFDTSPTLKVPGDWNSQDEKLFYYEGTIWYRRKFDVAKSSPENRLFIYFGAANYEADVYLNGKKLGKHFGGFTPFDYEVTGLVRPTGNSLVVRVNDTRKLEGVPTINTDWWNYGGITRDVLLIETPPTFISNFRFRLKPGATNIIESRVRLDGPQRQREIEVKIPELNLSKTVRANENGLAEFKMAANDIPLWSPENPHLNTVTVSAGEDSISDRIGFRTIETRGTNVLLNGKPVFLRGVSIHEENPLRGGRAWSLDDARLLLGWAKELNCNFVRLAHYPHNENMARLADQMGIMVWEEIPVYWTIQWTNKATLQLAQEQLKDVIARDQNRASVVVWSVANETPISPARNEFLKTLVDTARSADGTRLVSAAMEVRTDPGNPNHKIVDDPFGQWTDLLSFNEYIGWYGGSPDTLNRVTWTIKYPKPVFISEFGAGAKQGFHGDTRTRFTEEYQAEFYRNTLPMLQRIPGFSGTTPWILCDFRSPRRVLPGIQDGWNRKGLIGENGKKKEAFDVLKSFYDKMAESASVKNE
jgi:beta-glucuronidase